MRSFSFKIICLRSSWESSPHYPGHILSLSLAADHFVLELDVGLKPLTTCKACTWNCFEYEVNVKDLGIEHTMGSQDLIVEPDETLAALNFVQSFFSGDARGFLVSLPEWILHKSSLYIPSGTMFSPFSLGRKRS